MTRPRPATARTRALYHYMAAVMERLEWDLHIAIATTDRIPRSGTRSPRRRRAARRRR